MQSKLNTLLWSCLACLAVSAQEIRINEAIPFENGDKTSLAIAYAGPEKLTYFALDATKGVLTLDLPGVYSDVDFSQLQFAQVRAITQVPLNPDSNEGISISFFLRDGVLYSIYEGSPGELIIFFENGEILPKPNTISERSSDASPSGSLVVRGETGAGRLGSVTVETVDQVGLIQLNVSHETETRDFYLSGPRRFVLDLKETICSLDQDLIELNAPLVKQVRIRQFEVNPSPVTRMVLDLETKTEVRFKKNADGILLAFGPSEAEVDAVLTVGRLTDVESNPAMVEVASEPIGESPQSDGVAKDLIAAKPVLSQPAGATVSEEPVPAVELEQEDPVLITENASLEAQPESLPAHNSKTELSNTNNPTVAVENPSQVPDAPTPFEPTEIEQAVKDETPLTIVEDSAPVVQEHAATASEQAEPKAHVVAAVEAGALDEANQDLYQTFQERSGNEDNTVTLTLDAPLSEDLASIDEELDNFLEDGTEKTPYNLMRHASIKRPLREGPIFMNNRTVANVNQQFAEMAPLQEGEAGTDPDDLESIFAEPEANDSFETLSGSQKKYRGFEIDSIDVKNVQVIDLLRFLATQINVNLYIDSSVSSNLVATYKFTNMPWDLVLDMILNNANLDKEFSHGVLRVATVEKFRREAEERRELQVQRELAVPVETVHIPLSYAKAQDVEAIVRNYISPRGLILRDDRTNTLIIEDIPKRMLSIRALIKKLDKMISQVTIEARVVETTKRFLRELGIQWGLSAQYSPEIGTDTGMRFPNRVGVGGPTFGTQSAFGRLEGGYAVNFPVVDENPSGIGLSFGNFLDNFKLDISLQMLEDEGRGRIISAPKITTQNNKTATIQNGSRIPIQTIQRGTITIRYIDATLQLLVTPHITADETIIMDIVVDKSEPDFTRTVAGNPVINIRKADTRVLVKNGGTAVIGGIFSVNEQNTNRGIPGLRNVPVLRRVFSNERVEYTNQELLIFVTPRIVKY